MLKPRHRLRHQPWILVQVPVGVVEMGVPKIGGQRRQPALRVRASGVASPQDLDRHGMPQIEQPRPYRVRGAPHAEPFPQSPERAIKRRVGDAAAVRRYEEGLYGPASQEGVALFSRAVQGNAGRFMDRHEPGLAELAITNPSCSLIFANSRCRSCWRGAGSPSSPISSAPRR